MDPEVRFLKTGPFTLQFVWCGNVFSVKKLRNTLRLAWWKGQEYPEKPGKRVFSGCFPWPSLCQTEALTGGTRGWHPRVPGDMGTRGGIGGVPWYPWYNGTMPPGYTKRAAPLSGTRPPRGPRRYPAVATP